MKVQTIITLSFDDLTAITKASIVLKQIEKATGYSMMPTIEDIATIGDINSYRDGKFIKRTMQNVFADSLQKVLFFEEKEK